MDNPNPSWYKGGCIICGKKDGGWDIVECSRFIWSESRLDSPDIQPYVIIFASDGDKLYKGFPFCKPCYYNPDISNDLIDRAIEVIARYIHPSNSYKNCTRCGFEYPYGGAEICQSCKLWKIVGGC